MTYPSAATRTSDHV